MLSFIGWSSMGVLFIFLGIYALRAKEPIRFWNIQQSIQVSDTKKYNRAVAKLWFVCAVLFVIFGLPLLGAGQNSAWCVIPILGGMVCSIALMISYVRIEKKYRA